MSTYKAQVLYIHTKTLSPFFSDQMVAKTRSATFIQFARATVPQKGNASVQRPVKMKRYRSIYQTRIKSIATSRV